MIYITILVIYSSYKNINDEIFNNFLLLYVFFFSLSIVEKLRDKLKINNDLNI